MGAGAVFGPDSDFQTNSRTQSTVVGRQFSSSPADRMEPPEGWGPECSHLVD